MEITPAGSRPSAVGPAEWFTGAVRIDPLFDAAEAGGPGGGARVAGASVTFEPGARTAWHTHPLGQTLVITAGLGWAQREGGAVEELRPGDVVWFPPRREALARRDAHDGDDAPRRPGKARRRGRRVAGAGGRRGVSAVRGGRVGDRLMHALAPSRCTSDTFS